MPPVLRPSVDLSIIFKLIQAFELTFKNDEIIQSFARGTHNESSQALASIIRKIQNEVRPKIEKDIQFDPNSNSLFRLFSNMQLSQPGSLCPEEPSKNEDNQKYVTVK